MTRLPESLQPADSAPSTEADPSAIARRVEAISDLLQVFGAFRRFPSTSGAAAEHVTPHFAKPRTRAEMTSPTELVVALDFQFRASRASGDPQPMVQPAPAAEDDTSDLRMIVEAQYVIRYRLSAGPVPTAPELARFAEVNSPLNVVPYWREFLDSSLRRSGLPPAMAPVHKVEPIAKPPEPSPRGPAV